MNILILDTATKIELVLAQSKGRIAQSISPVDFSHSVTLFDTIDGCMQKLGTSISSINLIGVGIGPGSFTGIRIAVSTARMLAQVTQSPLIGIKTPVLYASSLPAKKNDNILVAFDAKKGRVFGALYKKTGDFGLEAITPPGDYPIESLLGTIDHTNQTIACGDGITLYHDIVTEHIHGLDFRKDFIPSGEKVLHLFLQTYKHNRDSYTDFTRVVPFYSRKSDAEIAREAAQKKKHV